MTLTRYYYQYSPERLSTCVLTVHALLHVADSIEAMGPAWAYWAFPTERFCGILQRHVKNRRYPFASLDTFAVASARLSHIGVRFDITQLLSLKPTPNVAVRGELRLHNCVYYEYLAGT